MQFSKLRNFPYKSEKWTVLLFLSLITLTLITTTHFRYTATAPSHRPKTKISFMNKNLCASSAAEDNNQRTAVIVVLSARNHFENRNLIRQTYGSVKNANNVQILAVVFMLGNSDAHGSDVTDITKLDAEMDRFGDIVMGDFVDSYRNLTLKTIMAYEWLTTYCREAQIVVKTDDDVFVNIFALTKELDSWSPTDVISSNFWCQLHRNESTVNNVNSRFYASPVDFPSGKFPDHCGGIGYVTTIGVIDRIVDEISRSYPGRVCTHEDVFMTAIVPSHINLKQESLQRPIDFVNRRYGWLSFVFENGGGDKDHFIRNFMKNTSMDIGMKNFNIFRKRNGKVIFYLFAHTDDFGKLYNRFWQIIKKSFSK